MNPTDSTLLREIARGYEDRAACIDAIRGDGSPCRRVADRLRAIANWIESRSREDNSIPDGSWEPWDGRQ